MVRAAWVYPHPCGLLCILTLIESERQRGLHFPPPFSTGRSSSPKCSASFFAVSIAMPRLPL